MTSPAGENNNNSENDEDREAEELLGAAVDEDDDGEGAEQLGEPGKRALDRMKADLKKARKEAADAQVKVREYEDAGKSESEKLNQRLAAAEQRAKDSEAKLLRTEVAAEKGLTAAQARRLVGETREELESDADDLLEAFGSRNGGGGSEEAASRRPRERLRPGASSEPDETRSASELADEVLSKSRGY